MIAIWILLGIVCIPVLLVLLHFISRWAVNRKCFRKYKHETIKKGSKFRIHLTGNPNIMLSRHHNTLWDVEDDDEKFAFRDVFEIGGWMFVFSHGKKFLDTHDPYSEGKVNYYGLYSVDGEKFWRCFWWGTHLYDNPFIRQKCAGVYLLNVLDLDKPLLEKEEVRESRGKIKWPYVAVITDGEYVNKRGELQPVKEIKFHYEEYRYESAFLRWLGIGHMCQKRRVYLEWNSSTGIRVNADTDWKGGAYASGIPINRKTEPELYSLYKRVSSGHGDALSRFLNETDKRIMRFMRDDRKY